MNKKDIAIECKDGFELAGTIYEPNSINGAIMITPATGIENLWNRIYTWTDFKIGRNNYCYKII